MKRSVLMAFLAIALSGTVGYGVYYMQKKKAEQEQKDSELARSFDNYMKEKMPDILQTAKMVVYIKELEKSVVEPNYDMFDVEGSISQPINALYASSQELRRSMLMCDQLTSIYCGMSHPVFCENDEERKNARNAFMNIVFTRRQHLWMQPMMRSIRHLNKSRILYAAHKNTISRGLR